MENLIEIIQAVPDSIFKRENRRIKLKIMTEDGMPGKTTAGSTFYNATGRTIRIAPIALLFLMILSISLASSPAAADDLAKAEMGINLMRPSYPEPNSKIIETRPMIAVDLSSLETPVDTASVIVLMNGADVTQSCDINASYIMYQPVGDLSPGTYEVRITAKDQSQKDIEPLAWLFEITGGAAGHEAEAAPEKKGGSNTTGHLSVSEDYASADYVPQSNIDTKSQFAEKEGMKINSDLSFTNTSAGRTLVGSYHRETQLYTDKEINKYRVNYYDPKQEVAAGNFRLEMSNLTVVGTELAGVRVDEKHGPWTSTYFSGKTQDPKFDGTFRQMTTGYRASRAWDAKSTTSFTLIDACEQNDPTYFSNGLLPAKDKIASIMHQYKYSDAIQGSLEIAGNNRILYTNRYKTGAARLFVSADLKKFSGEGEAYSINKNFLPVAEGSEKYLNSNRRGFRGMGKYAIYKWLSSGGEYEQYDSDDLSATATQPVFTTKRGNAFVALSPSDLPNVRVSESKLTTSEGTVSKSDNLMTSYTMKPNTILGETRISYNLTKMDYTTPLILSNTKSSFYSLSSAYKDKLGFSASYSKSTSDSTSAPAMAPSNNNSDSRDTILSMNWNIIPFKFSWNGRYEKLNNSGLDLLTGIENTDTHETRRKSMFRYAAGKTYAFTLGMDNIVLRNQLNPFYNYNENIVRTGMDWQF